MKLKRFNVYKYKGTKCTLIGFTRDKSMIPTRVWIETTQGNKIEIDRIKFESEAEYIKPKVKKKKKKKKHTNPGMKRKVIVKRYGVLVDECESVNDAVKYSTSYSSIHKCLTNGLMNNKGYSFEYKQDSKYELYILDELVGKANNIRDAKSILKCSRDTFEALIAGETKNGKSVKVG